MAQLVASASASKGAVLLTERPVLCFQTLQSQKECLVCSHCFAYIGTLGQQVSMLIGSQAQQNSVRSNVVSSTTSSKSRKRSLHSMLCSTSELTLLPGENLIALELKLKKDIIKCSDVSGEGCDAIYCTEKCREEAWVSYHRLLCCGGHPKGSLITEFHRHAKRTSETFLMGAHVVARHQLQHINNFNSDVQSPSAPFSRELLDNSAPLWWDVISNGDIKKRAAFMAEAHESWSLLQPWLQHMAHNTHHIEINSTSQKSIDFEGYGRVLAALELQLRPLPVESPLVQYCSKMISMSPELKLKALEVFGELIPPWEVLIPTSQSTKQYDIDKEDRQGGDLPSVHAEREWTRLMLAIGEPSVTPFPPLGAVCVLKQAGRARHSCVPNAQLEAAGCSTDASGLVAQLAALRDIQTGDEMTVAQVRVSQPFEARRADLRQTLRNPIYTCDCARCQVESGTTEVSTLPPKVVLSLADQALEEGRSDDARDLYSSVVTSLQRTSNESLSIDLSERNGKSIQSEECEQHTQAHVQRRNEIPAFGQLLGDALYGVGAASLAKGDWGIAHEKWREGVKIAPYHSALAAQDKKDKAYEPAQSHIIQSTENGDSECSNGGVGQWEALPGGQGDVFLTTQRLVTEKECRNVIDIVEQHANKGGGWTTSRHHAVPTTDIPVHSIPEVCDWFCSLLRERVFPMLTAQFLSAASENNDSRVWRVHDAFIVKYKAEEQRHLPVHIDQATHSLTVALNGDGEYEGGGTFLVPLKKGVKPGAGHVLSFKGDLPHGGDPITRGVRYIIAAFLYLDGVGNNFSAKALSTGRVGPSTSINATEQPNKSALPAKCENGGGFRFSFGDFDEG